MAAETRTARIGSVRFLPVGTVPRDVLRDLVARLSARLGLPCRLGSRREPIPLPILAGRGQGDADRLLGEIESLAGAPGEILVGVTAADIGHPVFTHFFGRARRHGRGAVVSLARLCPTFYGLPADRGLLVRRAMLEVVHELGHIAGLRHCDDYGCIMRFAPTVEAIDVRGTGFCASCAAEWNGLRR